MTQYSGGNTAYVTFDRRAYLTYDGNDLGFTSGGIRIGLGPTPQMMEFDQFSDAMGAVVNPSEIYIEGMLSQLHFSSGNLERLFHLTELDGGATLGRGTDQTGAIITGVQTKLSFISSIPAAVLVIHKSIMTQNGDVEFNREVDALSVPFRIVGIVDQSKAETRNLFEFWLTENTDLVTVTPSPADGALSVAVDAAFTVTFSEEMSAQTQDDILDLLTLVEADGTESQPSAASWNTGGTVVTLTHSNWTAATVHILQISSLARAASGKRIAGDGAANGTRFVSSFTTA